jgi:uroporphyrinogen decarboxylase
MTTAAMTGCERVNRMLARQDHDRVPRHDTYWPETIARWQREGLQWDQTDALRLLGSDFQVLCWAWPAPFPGRREILAQDAETETVRDAWGGIGRFWKGRSGTPEHIGFGCDSREAWEKIYRPALLAAPNPINTQLAALRYREGRQLGKWTYLSGVEAFEGLRRLIGDETCLVAMIEDPDWIRDIVQMHTDLVLRYLEEVLAAGVQPAGMWIYGDMAYNHSTMCSPAMYRDLVWPAHRRMADWAHRHGMKFIYHTDGRVSGVLDLYIEAGFDCLQPIEAKAGMDIRTFAPTHGDRLAMFGNIDVMKMATNDVALIEEEIRTKFAAGMATRGYAYHSDHSVPPQVSWATYQAIVGLVQRYGTY